MKKQNQNRTAI